MNFSIPRKSIFWVEKRQTADAAENPTETSHLEGTSPGLGPDSPSLARLDHNSRTDQSLLSRTDHSGSKSQFDNLSSTTRGDLRKSTLALGSRNSADTLRKGPRTPQTVKDLECQTAVLNESFKKRELRRPSTLNVRKPYLIQLYDQRITEEEKESFRSYSGSEDTHSNYESSVAYESSAYGEDESDNTSDDEENMDPMRQLVRRRLRKFLYASYFIGIAVSLQNRMRLYGTLKTIEKIEEPHQPEFKKLTINRFLPLMPSDNIRCVWTLILTFFTFLTVTLTPYQVAFIDVEHTKFKVLNILFDIVFGIDIIMNFVSAYYAPEYGLVTDCKIIMMNYMKTWFLFDLGAMMPIESMVNPVTTSFERLNKLLRLTYYIRLKRWFKMLRLFKMLKLFSTSKFFNKLIKRLNTNTGLITMLEFVVNITILNHLVGCIWYFLAKMYDYNPDTWVTKFGFLDSDSWTHYIVSFFWALQTLTTVGFGDIEPGTPIERVTAILWMVVGVIVYSFTIGSLSSILGNMDKRETALKAKVSSFNNFASKVKIPEFLRRKVQRYYELNHKENAYYWLEPYDVLKHLPESLKGTLLLYSYHSMTKNIEILEMNANFTAALLIHLKLIKLEKREILYREGDPSQEIYFISKGSVKMVNQFNQGIYTLVTGTYFGEIEIMQDKKRLCFAQACESTIIIVCDKNIFLETLKGFPDVESKIEKVVSYREDKLNTRLAQLKEELANPGENASKATKKPLANSRTYFQNILLNQQPKVKKGSHWPLLPGSSDEDRPRSKRREHSYYSYAKTPPNETTQEGSLQKLSDLAKILRRQKSDEKVKDDRGGKVRFFKRTGIKSSKPDIDADVGPSEENQRRKSKKNSPNVSFIDVEKKENVDEVKQQDTVKGTEPNSLQITPITSEGITFLKNRIEGDDTPREEFKKTDFDLSTTEIKSNSPSPSPDSNLNGVSLEGLQLKVNSSDFTRAFQQFCGGNRPLARFGSSSKEMDKLEYVKRVQEGLGEIRKLREITEAILSGNDVRKENVVTEFNAIAERQKTLNLNVEKLFSLLKKTG